MRKPLAIRIIGLAAIYCIVFITLVSMQFANTGNFFITLGAMTIRGSFLQDSSHSMPQEMSHGMRQANEDQESEKIPIMGGIRLFYNGIEFNLRDDRGNSLMLNGEIPVNPEFMILTENGDSQNQSASFILPDGTTLFFNSLNLARGPELQINAAFAGYTTEISIPVAARRSSIIRENEQVGIMFGDARYFFSTPGHYIEDRRIVLSRTNTFTSFRYRSSQRFFDPLNYIIAGAENFENEITRWRDTSFSSWTQNIIHTTGTLQNEDDIIAYLAEATRRGNYTQAVNAIRPRFINTSAHSHRSSVFTGGMENALRTFLSSENEKTNLINRLVRERSPDLLREKHILDYVLSRGNDTLGNDIIEFFNTIDSNALAIEHIAGLLEFYADVNRWRPNNLIDHLTDEILLIISDHLTRDIQSNIVYVTTQEGNNPLYNLRLGNALISWIGAQPADQSMNEWTAIGRSLVLSALASSNSGSLYNTLRLNEHLPRAVRLIDGHWVWTTSPSVTPSMINGNLNIAFSFPPTMSHHMIIRGVRPFTRLQIHGMDWRSDSQFETFDSSGWVYYPEYQILIVKLRHRANTTIEHIRIIYNEPPPPPPPVVTEVPPETEINE